MASESGRRTTDRPSGRVTLRDVAKLSGVSEISVSRVMRDAPNISPDLKAKVRRAATQLGYTPNRLAGALKTRSTPLVAVVAPSISHAVFPKVLDGVETALSARGLRSVLGITHYDPAREEAVLRDMLAWSPTGVILAGLNQCEAVKDMLRASAVPVVQMMDIDGAPLQTAVGVSHLGAARDVADYILARGYRRPGYIGAWAERPDRSRNRRRAFESRLAARGVLLRGRVIRDEESSAAAGAAATAELLRDAPDVDCVFYANDDLALGGLFHCVRTGIAVPERLALIGFNGLSIGLATPITLASVETPRFEMGVKAAEALLDRVAGASTPVTIDLGYRIREGESC